MIDKNLLDNHSLINVNLLNNIASIIEKDKTQISIELGNLNNLYAIIDDFNKFIKHNSWGIKKGQIVRHNNAVGKEFVKAKKKQLADMAHRLTILEKEGLANLETRHENIINLEKTFEQNEREQSRRLAHRVEALEDEAITINPEVALALLKATQKSKIKHLQKEISQSRVTDYKALQKELKEARLARLNRYEEFIAKYEKLRLEEAQERNKYDRNHSNQLFGKQMVEEEYNTYLENNRYEIEKGYMEYNLLLNEEEERLKNNLLTQKINHLRDLINEFKEDIDYIYQTLEATLKTIEERYYIAYKNQNNKNLIKIHLPYLDTTPLEALIDYSIHHHYNIYEGHANNMPKALEEIHQTQLAYRQNWDELVSQLSEAFSTAAQESHSIVAEEYQKNLTYFKQEITRIQGEQARLEGSSQNTMAQMKEEQKIHLNEFEWALKKTCESISQDCKKRLEDEKIRLNRDLAKDNTIIEKKIKAAIKK